MSDDVHFHLNEAVKDITRLLEFVAEQMAGLTPSELIEFREASEHFDALKKIKKAVQLVESEIVKAFSDQKVEVEYEGMRYWPARTKASPRFDGTGLASLCAARASDWYYATDPETGEQNPVPPFILAARIVNATARALGGHTESTSWRSTYLAEDFGITKDEFEKYRTFEPGNPTIKSAPAKAQAEAA